MLVALDTETHLIGPGAIFPKIVCLSLAQRGHRDGKIVSRLIGNNDPEFLRESAAWALGQEVSGANIAYDLGVLACAFPDLMPLIFQALAEGRVHDVQIRQKLINLGTHGKLETLTLPDGNTQTLSYSLATLVKTYLGRDRSEEKSSESSWRLNYRMLDGFPAEQYPVEAAKYAQDDAIDTLLVHEAQERKKEHMSTEWLHVAADFALKLMTAWGMPVDQGAVREVRQEIENILGGDVLTPLYESKILTPGMPPQPYANGAKNPDGTPKLKKAVPEKRNMGVLRLHLLDICREQSIPVKLTDSARSTIKRKDMEYGEFLRGLEQGDIPVKWVATDKKWLANMTPYSELIQLYELRQRFQKVLTSVIPMLEGEDRIFPNFDVLKETGRTSSYGSNPKVKRGERGNLYASLNIQQQGDTYKIGEHVVRARRMYAPPAGRVFAAADYSSLELCSVAQQTFKLFGYSRHKELLEQGVDLHSYLGAQIARRFHPEFSELCDDRGIRGPMDAYEYFLKAKQHEEGDVRSFFKHYRTLAKPVGLGYPGGLGPETMATLAWDTYHVRVSREDAKRFKDLWLQTYPEMPKYFEWVNAQIDPKNPIIDKNEDGDPIQGYYYRSPLGMVRRGATYCAAANGYAMQTPASEGAKIALFELARECYDPELGSCLYGARPVAFIHDEIILEVEDDERAHDRAVRLSEIMEESMRLVMPEVPISAEPLLMRRWSKAAEPVFVEGRLVPWDFQVEGVA